MATTIELTDREIAIARGENPDEVVQEPVEDTVSDEVSEELSEDSSEVTSSDDTADSTLEETTWVTSDIRDLAESYGFTDEDLSQFGDEQEFRRAGLLFDRQLVKVQQPPQDSASSTEPEAPAPTEESEEFVDVKKIEDAGYDEEVVEIAKALRRYQESAKQRDEQLKAVLSWKEQFEQAAQEDYQRRQAEEFHADVDGLDADLFGKVYDDQGNVVQLSDKHNDNRKKLWEAEQTILAGIEARATQTGGEAKYPSRKALRQRALQLAFSAEVGKKEKEVRIEKAKRQSAKRRPVGTQGGALPKRSPDSSDPKEIANHPDIVAFWKKAQEENGT